MSRKELIRKAMETNRRERTRLDSEYEQLGMEMLALVVDDGDEGEQEAG